jgi:hypothetical protein
VLASICKATTARAREYRKEQLKKELYKPSIGRAEIAVLFLISSKSQDCFRRFVSVSVILLNAIKLECARTETENKNNIRREQTNNEMNYFETTILLFLCKFIGAQRAA